MSRRKSIGENIGEKVEQLCKEMGLPVVTFTVDMTGGGRPYQNWTDKERKQARRALTVPEPPYAGYRINESRLPKSHPYFSLNRNGRVNAACSTYLADLEEATNTKASSKLVFKSSRSA